MAELEIDNYRNSIVFQYQFQKVTELFNEQGDSIIYSSEFYVRGLQWKFGIQPLKNQETNEFVGLGCYLWCNFQETGFFCETEYTFKVLRTLKSPFVGKKNFRKFDDNTGWGIGNLLDWANLIDPDENYLVLDSLKIEIHLSAKMPKGLKQKAPKDIIKQDLIPIAHCTLAESYATLLESENEADVTFIVKQDPELSETLKVKAHKLILKTRSPVFESMFSADMKETNSNQVIIDNMRESSLKILLHHIYTGNLDFPEGIEVDIDVCKELISAADMYNFPHLKEYAGMTLTEFITTENALEFYTYVKLHKASATEKAIGSYVERNFTIRDVLATL